jgi:quinol monooxygenase YgiN
MDSSRIYLMERFVARPDQIEAMKKLLQFALERTRQEPGCHQIEAIQSEAEPAEFVVFAHFADAEAVTTHRSAEWHKELASQLPSLLAGKREGIMGRSIV